MFLIILEDDMSEDRDSRDISGLSPRHDINNSPLSSPRDAASPREAASPRDRPEVIVPIVSPRPGSTKPAWLGKPIAKKDNV